MSWFGRLFKRILDWLFGPRASYATHIVVSDGVQQGENVMGAPLSNASTRRLDLDFQDDSGKSEKVQKGSVKASSSDESAASIAVDPSEKFATITPAADGESDEVTFTITADSDRGEGVREISGTYACAVVGVDATNVKITEGGDTPK